jgi:hypothetical protein
VFLQGLLGKCHNVERIVGQHVIVCDDSRRAVRKFRVTGSIQAHHRKQRAIWLDPETVLVDGLRKSSDLGGLPDR